MNDLKECHEYKECLQLLSFLSKQELLSKLNDILKIIEVPKNSQIVKIKNDLQRHIQTIEAASLETAVTPTDIVVTGEKLSRLQLKEV